MYRLAHLPVSLGLRNIASNKRKVTKETFPPCSAGVDGGVWRN